MLAKLRGRDTASGLNFPYGIGEVFRALYPFDTYWLPYIMPRSAALSYI